MVEDLPNCCANLLNSSTLFVSTIILSRAESAVAASSVFGYVTATFLYVAAASATLPELYCSIAICSCAFLTTGFEAGNCFEISSKLAMASSVLFRAIYALPISNNASSFQSDFGKRVCSALRVSIFSL